MVSCSDHLFQLIEAFIRILSSFASRLNALEESFVLKSFTKELLLKTEELSRTKTPFLPVVVREGTHAERERDLFVVLLNADKKRFYSKGTTLY